ncbi:hypothetical protein [Klebsiella oxytoca]
MKRIEDKFNRFIRWYGGATAFTKMMLVVVFCLVQLLWIWFR